MKKLFFLLLLFLCYGTTVRSQNYKNEVGLNLFRIQNTYFLHCYDDIDYQFPFIKRSSTYHCDYMKNYYRWSAPSIFWIHRIYKNLKWRSSLHYTKTHFDSYLWFGIDTPTFYSNVTSHTVQLTQGIQFDFLIKKKLNPYLIIEGAVNHDIIHSLKYSIGHAPLDDTKTRRSTNFQFSLGTGIRYQFLQRFSASVESLLSMYHEQHYPLSRLSINYHF